VSIIVTAGTVKIEVTSGSEGEKLLSDSVWCNWLARWTIARITFSGTPMFFRVMI
jgi:hypothetical protein